jgi:hypothetical protein
MLQDCVSESSLRRLKTDFLEVVKTCPLTTVREEPGWAASAIRHLLLSRDNGWGQVIKTDDDVVELAELCGGFTASAYPTGGRSGRGKIIVIRCDNRKMETQELAVPDRSNQEAEELFGFPVGTKKNIAAAMYLSKGATTEEVVKVVGDPKLNLLKEVEKMGFIVHRTKVKSSKGTLITKYSISRERSK